MASRLRIGLVTLAVICGVSVGAIVLVRYPWTRGSAPIDSETAYAAALPRPAPRDNSYVGSQACAACHEEIFETFSSSPMGQSMAMIGQETRIEDYESNLIEPPGNRQYKIVGDEKGVTHYEVMLEKNGDPFFEHGEEISYVVGSGRRGRGYLINRDGRLFQSPLTWYSQSRRWDLAPGYPPENHARFSRRIDDGCLYCHTGRMHSDTASADHKASADHEASAEHDEPFFAEVSISCERCHGPGERHVQLRSDPTLDSSSDPIINPTNLEPSKRDSVCNQCHLLGRSVTTRYGRGFFDFRPGDNLEDVFVVLSEEIDAELHGTLKAVNQVEQMRASKCYQSADGALGCVSCHDPHSTPAPEQRDEHFRKRCLTCHQTEGCKVELDVRQLAPANNSCIHCHMPKLPAGEVPHTSLTEHRILRHGKETEVRDKHGNKEQPALDVFDNADQRLPRAEVDRAKGIALMTTAWRKEDAYLAARAQSHLLKLVGPLGENLSQSLAEVDDVPLLVELGAGFFLLDDLASAEDCWRRVLKLNPLHETALKGIAKVAEDRSDLEVYRECLDKLAEVNPSSADLYSMRVRLQYYSGDMPGAAKEAERALEIDPTLVDLRSWLVGAYRDLGDEEKEKLHLEFLEKMGITQPDPDDAPLKKP